MEDGGCHAQPPCFLNIAGRSAQGSPIGSHAILAHHDAFIGGGKVGHRFGHAVEHQANPHACCEQHGEPTRIGVIGNGFFAAETNLA